MPDGDGFLSRAEGMDPSEAARDGLSGVILAMFGGVIMVVSAMFDGLANILDVFDAAREFFVTLITSPTVILEGTARETLQSLTTGEWAFFGPLTFSVGVFSVALGFYAWLVLDPEIPLVDDLVPWR